MSDLQKTRFPSTEGRFLKWTLIKEQSLPIVALFPLGSSASPWVGYGKDTACTRCVWTSHEEQRRRAVLVVTDNLGRPAKSEQAIIEDFWESDTLLSALIIPKHQLLAALITGREPGGVDRVVEETGGDLVRTNDVGNTFVDLLQRLRLRYGLYYRLPKGASGTLRQVRVGTVVRSPNSSSRSAHPCPSALSRSKPRREWIQENGNDLIVGQWSGCFADIVKWSKSCLMWQWWAPRAYLPSNQNIHKTSRNAGYKQEPDE
jgi:hypothetical protein